MFLRHFAAVFLSLLVSARAQEPIKATTTMHPDGTRSTTIVDPEKRTSEETIQDSAGKTLRKTTYLLDDRNQPLGAISYDAKGTVVGRASYRRDALGRIDEETISTAAGQMVRKRIYSYGAQNKVSRVDEYDAAGNLLVPPKRTGPGRPDVKKRK